VLLELATQLPERPVSRFAFSAFHEARMKLAQPPHAFRRGLECFVGEIHGLAIVRLEEQESQCSGVDALLPQIPRGEKISVTLRHLRAAHVEKLAVHPVPREWLAGRTF